MNTPHGRGLQLREIQQYKFAQKISTIKIFLEVVEDVQFIAFNMLV